MAALLILLTVVDEGLGAVYFLGIVPEAVDGFRAGSAYLADFEPIGAIATRHDAETERRDLSGRRKPLAEMVHYGSW